MKTSQKGFIAPLLLALIAVLLIGGGVYVYVQNNQSSQPVTETTTSASTALPFITVTYPNGGETVKYSDIYLAGDLYFNWTTSQKESYVPTSNKKVYVIDSSGKVIRDDPVFSSMNLGDGNFRSSFAGEGGLKANVKYKIKVCDYIDSREYCDSSDDYFIIQ